MKKSTPVALVISNPILLLGFEEMIAGLDGFDVTMSCDSAGAFFEMIAEEPSAPEICLLHLSLHQGGSAETISRFLTALPTLKVLAVSASNHPYSEKKAMAYGAAGYIPINSPKEEVHRALVNLRFIGHYFNDKDAKGAYTIKQPTNTLSVEAQLLRLLCTETSYQDIAQQMGLSMQMVEECTHILFEKFEVTSRVGLTVSAYEMGLLGE